jgi:hypothetical protein
MRQPERTGTSGNISKGHKCVNFLFMQSKVGWSWLCSVPICYLKTKSFSPGFLQRHSCLLCHTTLLQMVVFQESTKTGIHYCIHVVTEFTFFFLALAQNRWKDILWFWLRLRLWPDLCDSGPVIERSLVRTRIGLYSFYHLNHNWKLEG